MDYEDYDDSDSEPTYCRDCGEEIDWRQTHCDDCRPEGEVAADDASDTTGEGRVEAWREAVAAGDTRLGFAEWQDQEHPAPCEGGRPVFADPGGNSALRAASRSNPRNLPCPTCGEPNRLTPLDRRCHYQCDDCADRAEGRGD